MPRYVVGPAALLPPGTQRRVDVGGRAVAIFNVEGNLYALRDVCPHQGAALSCGAVVGELRSERAGDYRFDDARKFVMCPWHGWQYDLATGQSWSNPTHDRVRAFPISVEQGARIAEAVTRTSASSRSDLVPGPYVAETFPIVVENDYIVVEVKG